MATIAELQIKVDSTETERGTKALLALAEAADKAAAARKRLNDIRGGGGPGGGGGGGGDDSETRRTRSLSEAIDAQVRKLADLARQRKSLNESTLRTEDPEQYKRLNAEIDARTELVRRQGNSLDRLSAQAKREQEQRERAADAAKRIAEREAAQAQQKEEREARAAAAAQRRLDATISSLSRQVKAQEDYNRTVAQLNAARAPTSGSNPALSAAEYDTYVKQAAALRDAALARADNTREIERAQRAYDASVASLGKVERAQALYTKNLKDSDNALRLNLITQEQYNTQVAAFAARRDASIAAANSNSQAEARLAAQLQSVLSAYDPVLRATDSYNSSVRVLVQGLQSGKLTVEQFNKALTDQRTALESVKAAQSNSTESQAKQYQSAIDRLLPFNAQLRNLNEAERILQQTRAAGRVTTEQQIKDYERATKAIAAERAEIERRSQAERRGNSAKQDAAALRGLPAQFTDVVVSLQGGQAPLTVLLQQGGQVKDMFGGVANALKAVGGALLAMISPLTIAASVLGVFAFAAYSSAQETNALRLALATTGVAAGLTVTSATDLAKSMDDVSSSTGRALRAISQLAATGTVTNKNFEDITRTILYMNRVTGASIESLVSDFSSIGKDPVRAVQDLITKYGILDSSLILSTSVLVSYGEKRKAVDEIERLAAKQLTDATAKIEENLTSLQRFARDTKDVFIELGDAISKAFRASGNQEVERREASIGRLQDALDQANASGNKTYAARIQDELTKEQQILDTLKEKKKTEADTAAANKIALQDAADAQTRIISRYDATLDSVTRANNEIKKQAADWKLVEDAAKLAGRTISQQERDYNEQAKRGLQERLKSAQEQANRPKGGASPIDSREVQEVKSNLSVITSQYDAAYKKITALGAANVVSQEATFASQKALLERQKDAISGSYDGQIESIKKLQGVKGNTVAQNISLDNQLTRAEDARLKAMQDVDAKLEVLATNEKGRLQRRTDAIEAYNEALRSQIDNVKTSGERAVSAVGQGDRQTTLNDNLADVDRQFAKDQASLAKQLSKGMDPVEYAANLKNLTEAHNEMTAQILRNDSDIQAANADWTNGFTKAIQNLADEANNMAGAVNSAVSGAFASMGDALGTFVTTGKLDFKSLASSILSDMAKIAARAATNAALSSLFSFAGAAFGAGAAAGGTTVASSGFSETLSTPYAKGGGFSGGTQFFAQGGAFTNSIVSSPTAFGMSGGGRGVMGEAGPEAIVPLARAADGSLGVRMIGGAGGQSSGGVNVYVTINSDGSASSETDKAGTEQFGREIGTIIESKYRQLLARDLRDGGDIKNAIKAG